MASRTLPPLPFNIAKPPPAKHLGKLTDRELDEWSSAILNHLEAEEDEAKARSASKKPRETANLKRLKAAFTLVFAERKRRRRAA